MLSQTAKVSIAGGGDIPAAIDLFGIADKISSTMAAFLEFVEGKVLPAVAMLEGAKQ